jgi:hypothetical protein
VYRGGGWEQVGGTSLASPLWAGFTAVLDANLAQPITQAAIHSGLYLYGDPANIDTYFHDIVSGNNGRAAGPGYDLVTGIGTPILNALLPALAGMQPPVTVATAASATPSPVSGTSTSLSVLGGYTGTGGESALTYRWSSTGPATVTYSINGTNAAKHITATFAQAGSYDFTVTIASAYRSTTSSVLVAVDQTTSAIAVAPGPLVTLAPLPQAQQFSATAVDQFGNTVSAQPPFAWSLASGSVGSIATSSGLYHSGTVAGTATVKARSGSFSGTATVELAPPVTIASAAVAGPSPVTGTSGTLSALGAYAGTGGAASLTYTWAETSGPAAATFSSNGTNAAKNTTVTFTQAGTYAFTVTITSPIGTSTTSSVTITVNQTLTSIAVTPGPTLTINPPLPVTQQFTATALDQFGNALSTQPVITWGLASGSVGSVSDTGGLYHSGKVAGSATVKAESGSVTGTCAVTIN